MSAGGSIIDVDNAAGSAGCFVFSSALCIKVER